MHKIFIIFPAGLLDKIKIKNLVILSYNFLLQSFLKTKNRTCKGVLPVEDFWRIWKPYFSRLFQRNSILKVENDRNSSYKLTASDIN